MLMEIVRALPEVALVVDDQALLRMELVDTFKGDGFDVLEAAEASEALTLLAGRSDISVLVTDVDMPGKLNGFTLARVARKMCPSLIILVTSGRMVPEARDLPRGGQFLPRPYAPEQALSAIHRMMGAA